MCVWGGGGGEEAYSNMNRQLNAAGVHTVKVLSWKEGRSVLLC